MKHLQAMTFGSVGAFWRYRIDHLCMATSESSVQHEELVQEVLKKCVMGESECVMGYFEDTEERIQCGYTKDHSAEKCFFRSTSLQSIKEAYRLMYCLVWMQPFDVSCYIK